ncbi:MAG: hypothetical protein AAFN78_10885 [Pseudomonadota bacterium]
MKYLPHLASACLAMFLAGCATAPKPPEPLEVGVTQEIQAEVVSVNHDTRLLVLRGPEGNELVTRAGPEVRNLAQVRAGDVLTVAFYTGYTVAMAEPGSSGADVEMASERRPEGERPGAAAGLTTRATIEIFTVAEDGSAVSFRDSEGRMQVIDVRREESREFARKLKKGDKVDLTYTEAVAVSVDPGS